MCMGSVTRFCNFLDVFGAILSLKSSKIVRILFGLK